MHAFTRIEEQAGFVVVDFRGCSLHEFFETYQELGGLCARKEMRGALLRTGDEQADTHYALRDILATLARIAEIPVRFKVAVVSNSDAIAHVCWMIQDELRALGCEARLFRVEGEADRWLRGIESPTRIPTPRVATV